MDRQDSIDYFHPDMMMEHALLPELEESIDIKHHTNFVIAQNGPPARGEYPGPYGFEMFCSDNSDRKQYLYSQKTNTVYLNMMTDVPIDFRWNWEPVEHQQLIIRATLVLADKDKQESKVSRCHNHLAEQDKSNSGINKDILPHVLRSIKANENDVIYCGSPHNSNEWLSVAVKMGMRPSHGCDTLRNVYQFSCKHSCTSGINRRKVEVIFTLEDLRGDILGRRTLGFRVCSCPKRDMLKAESEHPSHSYDTGGPPPTKKQKTLMKPQVPPIPPTLMTNNADVFDLNIKVVGVDNAIHILTTAYNAMMTQMHALTREDPMWEICSMSLTQIQLLLSHAKQEV